MRNVIDPVTMEGLARIAPIIGSWQQLIVAIIKCSRFRHKGAPRWHLLPVVADGQGVSREV